MMNVVWNNPWVRALGLILSLLLLAVTLYLLNFVVVPLFIAFIVAYIFNPIILKLEERKFTRMAAIVGVLLLILVIAVSVPCILLPNMIDEAKEFARAAPRDAGRPVARDPADGTTAEEGLETRILRAVVEALDLVPEPPTPEEGAAGVEVSEAAEAVPGDGTADPEADPADYDPRDVLLTEIGTLIEEKSERAFDLILANAATLVGLTGKGAESVAGVVVTVWNQAVEIVLILGNIVLFTFVTVYLLRDYAAVVAGMRDLIPDRHRGYLTQIFSKIDRQLQAFFRGQLIVCACLGTLYCIGLSIAGTPFALTLGIFGGIVSFVPFLGLALTIGPAVLLTLLYHGLDWHVVAVLLTFVGAQSLEGNFLTPKIVGSQVGLGPVWVILAVMVFGTTLGFKGLLIAVPLAATCKVLVVEAVGYYKNSSFFTGS